MLTSALMTLIKNPIKESFYGKRKKIYILTAFFIFHKSGFKTSITGFLTSALRVLVNMTRFFITLLFSPYF